MINNFLKIIKKNGAKIIFIQSIIFISFFISNLGSFTRKNLELYFFDIGQGDSIFIRTTDNIDILIDSGPNGEVVSQLGSVMPFWDRKIDLVILTHPDLDHIGGLPDILKYYEIENILFTGIDHESNTYQYLLDEIDSLNIQKLGFRDNDDLKIGCCLYLDIIWPEFNTKLEEYESNETSVVFNLIHGENNFFFGGDLSSEVEDKLVEQDSWLHSDLIKVGHHGSSTSTSKKFIQKLNPDIAVISAGRDNKFGHPHDDVIAVLENEEVRILRTDRMGTIKVVSDGNDIYY